MRTLLTLAAIAALTACGQTATVEPPAEPAAVETPAPLPAAPLTEADARTRAETAGYTNITSLVQNADGSWSGTGALNGATTSITINDAGVTAAGAPAPATP